MAKKQKQDKGEEHVLPMKTAQNPGAAQQPAVNVAAVCTLPATAGGRWDLFCVRYSYDGAPTGGKLTIAWTDVNNVARSEVYGITASGPGQLLFVPSLTLPATVAPTITLAAAGAAVKGTVFCDAIKGKL
jgi:hypothetical protein